MDELNLNRRTLLQGIGFASINYVMPRSLSSEDIIEIADYKAKESAVIYRPEFEAFSFSREIEDYFVSSLEGKIVLEKLVDSDLCGFASNIIPIDLSYLNDNREISGTRASFVSYQRYSVGDSYDLVRGFYPDHAHFDISQNSTLDVKLGDLKAMGAVYLNDNINRANKFSDVVEGWFFINKNLSAPSKSYKLMTTKSLIESESNLKGKDFFAIGYPAYYEKLRNGKVERFIIPMKFDGLSYELDSTGNKRPFSKFYPKTDLDPKTLPGLSGGAIGYLDEEGSFVVVSSVYGYEPQKEYYLIGSPFADNCMSDLVYPHPWKSTKAWDPRLTESLISKNKIELAPLERLVSFLIKKSNYPVAHLERMLMYGSEVFGSEYNISDSLIYKDKPTIIIKSGKNDHFYSWNDDILKPKFVKVK